MQDEVLMEEWMGGWIKSAGEDWWTGASWMKSVNRACHYLRECNSKLTITQTIYFILCTCIFLCLMLNKCNVELLLDGCVFFLWLWKENRTQRYDPNSLWTTSHTAANEFLHIPCCLMTPVPVDLGDPTLSAKYNKYEVQD